MSARLDLGLFTRPTIKMVRQTEVAECGLACLAMVASYHGLAIDIAVLRRRFAPSTRGVSMRSLMATADRLGFMPRAVQVDLDSLSALATPAVLHWDFSHFVVVEAVSGKRALIHNPSGQSGWLRFDEISRHFTGVALELEPSATFEAGEFHQKLRLNQLWSRLRGVKRAVVQTVLLSVILQIFALASPYYLQLAVDSALPELNVGFLTVLAIGFAIFAILNGVATLLRSAVLLAVGTSFGFGMSSNIARKLFRLPMDWFGHRNIGDILSRFQSVIPIRQMLAEDAPATLVDGTLALLTLVLMSIYSPLLSLASASALVLYGAVRATLFKVQRAAQEEMIVASGLEQSILIDTLRGMRSLRLSGRETFRHALWQSRMIDSLNGSVRFQRLTNWQNAIHATFFTLENVLVVWLSISMVIRGGFSLGMVFAYLAYKAQFLTAGASLVDKATAFKMLGLHLERLSDIALADEDVSFLNPTASETPLKGKIELRGIHYRYGSSDPFVLRGVDLVVEAGESVAITGPSGGGKSTMVQIILGLIEPTAGEVLVDGVSLRSFGYQNYHRQIAAVLQDDSLFAGSIAENISMFDEQVDPAKLKAAATAASIDGDVEAMPMGYETLVGDMGSALSGGQRQRILLARALYREPRILVMDEGTSHLDEAREQKVNQAIADMGITRIIVAHRKETIASAERVLILEEGALRTQENRD